MSDGEVYSASGHLTVERSLDNGTSLVETWVMARWASWGRDTDCERDDPLLTCYVADRSEDTPPDPDYAVQSSCKFSEAPESVRAEFIEQMNRISAARCRFTSIDSLPHADEDPFGGEP